MRRFSAIMLSFALALSSLALTGPARAAGEPTAVPSATAISCVKLEGSDIGLVGASAATGGMAVTVTDWVDKDGSAGEYVGFTYVVSGGTPSSITVKASTEYLSVDPATAGSWTHPSGSEGYAISHISFCFAVAVTVTPDLTTTPAASETPQATETAEEDEGSSTHPLISVIAAYFGVPDAEVEELRSYQGMGFGNIAKVYFLSEATGESVDSIVALREEGMGWGQIAKDLGVHPSNRCRNLGRIVGGGNKDAKCSESETSDAEVTATPEATTTTDQEKAEKEKAEKEKAEKEKAEKEKAEKAKKEKAEKEKAEKEKAEKAKKEKAEKAKPAPKPDKSKPPKGNDGGGKKGGGDKGGGNKGKGKP